MNEENDEQLLDDVKESFIGYKEQGHRPEAEYILYRLKQLIPPCPSCKSKDCNEWTGYYMEEMITRMLGPNGFFNILVAATLRNGKTLEFTFEEMKAAQARNSVVIEFNEEGHQLRVRIVDALPLRSEWPDFIG